MPTSGDEPAVHFPKGYEKYRQGVDEDYYLGLGKQTVLNAKWDMLGDAALRCAALRWEHAPGARGPVASASPRWHRWSEQCRPSLTPRPMETHLRKEVLPSKPLKLKKNYCWAGP